MLYVYKYHAMNIEHIYLCCLLFPSCSVFFDGCSIAHFLLCFLQFGCLMFVLPLLLSFRNLLSFACCMSLNVYLWLLLWSPLLEFPSFVVVHNCLCMLVSVSVSFLGVCAMEFLMGGRF